MIDFVTIWAGATTIGCGVLTYLWRSACIDRDKVLADLTVEETVAKALENRVKTLRGDNVSLEEEVARLRAEMRANKPKRGPDGKFLPKPPLHTNVT